MSETPDFLRSGQRARLIPVVADTSKEERAASIFLSTLSAVPLFGREMLATLGQRVGKRAHIDCYTEVEFRVSSGAPKLRPDGLLIVTQGEKRWSALIEAKIGRAELDEHQVTGYLQLAKDCRIDSLITLSNQFVALPTHHLFQLPKTLLRGVDIFHWSWMFVLTQATLTLGDTELDSPDQRFILNEMVRYFRHDSVGVAGFDRMNAEWKDLVASVQTGAELRRATPEVENSIASWHQEARDLCLLLSRRLGRQVSLRITPTHRKDPVQRFKDDCEHLTTTKQMTCTLDVPDAAAPIVVEANLGRRNLVCSMKLAAPQDRKRSSARINWLIRQLGSSDATEVFIKAYWPGRAPATQCALRELKEDASRLESDNRSLAVQSFEIMMVRDLAAKFTSAKAFIRELEDFVPRYYEKVGQHLRAWIAPPPQLERRDPVDATEDVVEAQGETKESDSETSDEKHSQ